MFDKADIQDIASKVLHYLAVIIVIAAIAGSATFQRIQEVTVDDSTHAITQISHEHHEMHDGCHYFVKTAFDDSGGAGSVTEFMFTTPDNGDRIHARTLISPSLDYTIEIYEGVTTSADGTPIAAMNNDRDSTKTAGLTPFAAPTVTDDGDLMWLARSGGTIQRAGVSPGLNYEIIAKTNTKYLFRLTKTAANAGVVDVDFWWYEHTAIE